MIFKVKRILQTSFLKKINTYRHRALNSYPYRDYFDKHQCIFIHIPKCAGTSILTDLSGGKNYFRDHLPWSVYLSYDRPKYQKYFKFTFVRNPYDRVVSTYFYLKKGGNLNEDLYFKELIDKGNISFENFVLDFLDGYNIHEHILFKPQYLFLYDYQNNLMVDHIAKFEKLDNEYYNIQKKIKIRVKSLPKINSSYRKSDFLNYYTSKTISKIFKLYKKDFELLNYTSTL